MNIYEAFEMLCETDEFKRYANVNDSYGGKLRSMQYRYKQGTLSMTAIAHTLYEFGYNIDLAIKKVDCHYKERL